MLSEAVLSAITETIFNHLIQDSGLAEHAHAVLGIDPQRRAFQTAFAKAYSSFAKQHPDWVAALFDEAFLTGPAAPLLATLITRRGHPAPEDLARRWCDHLGREATPHQLAEATRVAANFLAALESELANQPILQAVWDSRALDQISHDVAEIRRLLDEQFRTALDASRQVTIGGEVRDSVVITGDRNTVSIQHVIAPIRCLPIEYTTRIKNFLDTYLGTPQHPVTFGGREEVLRQLDNWLADPTTPYLLLTAPAGRGKSALLAQWLAQLCSSLPIVFVPISIRFSTNSASVAFASLAAQLARSFNEEIRTDANTPNEVWRDICSSYLQRQPPQGRLLVVLDGIDEAADWDADGALFPLNPPPGLKVIVSARLTAQRSEAKDWIEALVWDRLNVDCLMLDPLDKTGLSDVLKKMDRSLDQLAHQPFIDELYRLTGGEPLLVRLYVEDLWQSSTHAPPLTVEYLRTIKPGYKGYYRSLVQGSAQTVGE